MGRCHGGFLYAAHYAHTVARAWRDMGSITKDGEGSYILTGAQRRINESGCGNSGRRPAGLAAAIAAKENGAPGRRYNRQGGRPGRHTASVHTQWLRAAYFGEELTGPEYAARYIDKAKASGANF